MSSRPKDLSPQLEAYFGERPQYKHYLNYKSHVSLTRNIDDMLICLKGMSSSTPFFHSSAFEDVTGGGFYFRYKDKGIVVDPGIGFVAQMHRNHVFIDDVDFVIITHNHIDHCNDASSLSAMNYDYNKFLGREHKFFSNFFEINKPPHSIVWIVDDESSKQVKKFTENEEELILLSDIAKNPSEYFAISDLIDLSAFHTKHIKDSDDSFGIKLRFKYENCNHIWGYSSDTAYFSELLDFFADCKALILNISDVYKDDVKNSKFKSSHLGYSGCKKIIENTKADLVLISEFTCMNGDNRFEITKLLSECAEKTRVLPTEIGLRISIVSECIACSFCEKQYPPDQIRTLRPKRCFSDLKYVCNNCLI